MAATYLPTLDRTTDWVRFLCGDRDMARPTFQDEELKALLVQEGNNKYFAAAAACRLVAGGRKGLTSKTVGDLSLTWSDTVEGALEKHIEALMMKGHTEAAGTSNAIFRTT